MALKHWQDGLVGEGGHLYLHTVMHSARALTDGAGKAASTSKIVSDLVRRLPCRPANNDEAAPVAASSES
jgi:hypothetical protein